MKYRLFIDENREEEVLIYAKKETALTRAIQHLLEEAATPLVGYRDKEAVRMPLSDIQCFFVEGGKVFAFYGKEKLLLRCRLYQLEESLPESFIKINQSCLANIRKIDRFDASISGTLMIRFQNGHTDFVSRRNVKQVKKRLEEIL